MKKLFTLIAVFFCGMAAISQTTEYTTGQTYGDPWTGWSTPVVTGVTGSSVNGVDVYTFSGTSSNAYTIEMYRQFNINSNDIDIYLAATTQNATVSVEYSSDNVSYSQIATQNWGAGFAQSTIVIPTYDPVVATFYLKLKMTGTFASPSQAQFNNLKIDAVLNSGNSNAIAPTATQNLLEGANGNLLVVTEMALPASSREWKYSTTSGSGYVSFGTAETGTTYTPNFASAGTYYVICESNFSGDMQTSNEVQINVTAPVAVEEFELGSNVLFANGELQVIASIDDYTVSIYDISGKLIISQLNLKSYNLAIHNEGIYFISIVNNGLRKTIKIAHSK